MYIKEFEIRWSDVDANGHMANAAYLNFMSHTRMAFLMELGFNQQSMVTHNIGPVVFHEHVYYFKEAFIGTPVRVSLELNGLSEDGMFFEFHHNFYDEKGRNFAHCEVMGAWIDLTTRSLTGLARPLLNSFNKVPKSGTFKVLTREDTRKFSVRPKDLV
ncbi:MULTISPECIES: acyl-CoA thioesterase [Arenibacter]|uniref:acyl-CoA thioesterase n=1 Tax=Arenibacter TaxID=178469 RepID=UPI000A3AA723|nr:MULTISPECIES: acyl-CoA thioesterase [Arenibacter]